MKVGCCGYCCEKKESSTNWNRRRSLRGLVYRIGRRSRDEGRILVLVLRRRWRGEGVLYPSVLFFWY